MSPKRNTRILTKILQARGEWHDIHKVLKKTFNQNAIISKVIPLNKEDIKIFLNKSRSGSSPLDLRYMKF